MEVEGENSSRFSFTYTEDYNSSSNSYDSSDYGSDACYKTDVIHFGERVTPIFFIMVIMLSCVGNALVLWVLIKYENLKSLTNTFLLNLAISDLIFTLGLPFWSVDHISGWIFGEVMCKSVSFIFYLGYYSSLLFLTVMTVHRYIAVVHPLSMLWNSTIYHSIGISVVIWSASFCAAIPYLIYNTTHTGLSKVYCDFINDVTMKCVNIYVQNCFFLTAFVTIAFCYVRILVRLLRPTSHTRPKTVKLILCIVIAFYLGWAPYNVSIFLSSLIAFKVSPFNECDVSTVLDYIFIISRLVAFSHCCLNPMFYVFMGVKFRDHLKKVLMNFCTKGKQHQDRRHSHLIYSNGEEVTMY